MAQITKLVDDLDGESEAFMTLKFGVENEGTGQVEEYEIDLKDSNYEHYKALIEMLAQYGRKVTREPVKAKRTLSTGKKTSVVGKTQEMREWLRANGHNVSDRGRVPTHLVDLYETRPRLEAVKPSETPEEARKGDDTDEDKKAEEAVIQRVKSTPKAAPTTRRKSTAKNTAAKVEIPAIREVLSLVDGEK